MIVNYNVISYWVWSFICHNSFSPFKMTDAFVSITAFTASLDGPVLSPYIYMVYIYIWSGPLYVITFDFCFDFVEL